MYLMIGAKLVVAFLCLLLYLNLSGRSQLAPNSAVDQIGNYVLGGIVGGVIYSPAISVLEMVLVIAIWSALMLSLRFFKARNRRAERIIDGQSLLLFKDGEIQTNTLRMANKTVRTFIADMHIRNIHRLEDLQCAWLETNGQYTILKKGETPFPIALIEDGQIVEENMESVGHDIPWLKEQLAAQGVTDSSKVAYAEWHFDKDADGKQLHLFMYQ